MRATGQADRHRGAPGPGRTHALFRWTPGLGQDWILSIHGLQFIHPDPLPEATKWEEDGSCCRCGRYKEDHLGLEADGRFFCYLEDL